MTAHPATNARFWDQHAARYAKQPVADPGAYQRTLERVRAHLRGNARVLEVGCGTGTTALELAAHAASILATDVSANMIAIARKKAQARGTVNVRFTTGTLDSEGLAPESFDAVMAFNLMHLLDDVPAAVRRARQLLAPGGLFISKTPCLGDGSRLLRGVIPLLRLVGKAPYVRYVTQQDLLAALSAEGFEVLETGLYPRKTHSFFVVAHKRPA